MDDSWPLGYFSPRVRLPAFAEATLATAMRYSSFTSTSTITATAAPRSRGDQRDCQHHRRPAKHSLLPVVPSLDFNLPQEIGGDWQ